MLRNEPREIASQEAELKAFFYRLAEEKGVNAREKGKYAMAAVAVAVAHYYFKGASSILDYAVMLGCAGITAGILASAVNDFSTAKSDEYMKAHPEYENNRIDELLRNIDQQRIVALFEEAAMEVSLDHIHGKKVNTVSAEAIPQATAVVTTARGSATNNVAQQLHVREINPRITVQGRVSLNNGNGSRG